MTFVHAHLIWFIVAAPTVALAAGTVSSILIERRRRTRQLRKVRRRRPR